MLSTSVFLSVFFGTLGLIFALLIPFFLLPLKNDMGAIRNSVRPLEQLDQEISRLGLREFLQSSKKKGKHNSLPPERALRRDELLNKARFSPLEPNESEELKSLLSEDAQGDFVSGLIGALALIALLALIGAFVDSITKKN